MQGSLRNVASLHPNFKTFEKCISFQNCLNPLSNYLQKHFNVFKNYSVTNRQTLKLFHRALKIEKLKTTRLVVQDGIRKHIAKNNRQEKDLWW